MPTRDPSARTDPPTFKAALGRAFVFAGLVLALFFLVRHFAAAGLVDRGSVAAFLDELRHSTWAAPAQIGLLILFSISGVPVTPLILGGAAVFGVGWGWLFSLTGTVLGAALAFALARGLARDLVLHLINPKTLERVSRQVETRGFWTLVRLRFVPIPFALVNYAAALAGVSFRSFLLSTLTALAPVNLVTSFVGHALAQTASAEPGETAQVMWRAGFILLAIFLLTWLPGLIRAVQRKRSRAAQDDSK